MARFGRRHPIQPIIKRNNVSAAAAAGAPVPPPLINWRAAVETSLRRHAINRGLIVQVRPVGFVNPAPRVRRKFSFPHDETIKNKNSRAFEQQVAKYLNQLLLSGEFRGTPQSPSLGYVPDDPTAVGTTESLTLSETLHRIIAAIKALNGTGI